MSVGADLDRRFREAAVAASLLDLAYDVVDSPVGDLLVGVTPRGVCRISYDADSAEHLERLARAHGVRVLRAPRAVDPARTQLHEYFEGRRRSFDVDVDLGGVAVFNRAVLDELARVPYGEVTTYGTLAKRAGRPQAAGAVGMVMNRNPIPIVLPCHRVVGSTGKLVGYAGGLARKEALLRLEGALL